MTIPAPEAGPLSEAELQQLESTLLPALERHHLRLLAHGLRTLQQIAGRRSGPLPDADAIERWVLAHPAVQGDQGFSQAFSAQLRKTGEQLECIAQTAGCSALDLSLDPLIEWSREQADRRIATS